MAKELPTTERFRLYVEVAIEDYGPVCAQLAKMPVVVTGNELITEVHRFKGKVTHDITTEAWLTDWIKDHPTFKIKEPVKVGREDGRTAAAVYQAARVLCEKEVLKKLGEGRYSRTDVQAIEGPTKKANSKNHRYDKRSEDVILAYARRNHRRFNVAKLKEVFVAEGRPASSVYPSVDKLIKHKLAKRVGETGSGQYVLIEKAKPKTKKKPLKAQALNGSGEATPSSSPEATTEV